MAASVGIQKPLLILLLSVVKLSVFGEQHAAEALTVANNLHGQPLTILTPPGCCSSCPPNPPPGVMCPDFCVQCPSVVIQAGKAVPLDKRVGLLPHEALQIQVQESVYCVRDARLTASATLAIGPGSCGPVFGVPGLHATMQGARLCLPPCNV